MGLLDGKTAIVTGAGNGIGRAHALLFAREGARVIVNDPGCTLDGEGEGDSAEVVTDEIRSAGGEAVANQVAVGTFEAADELIGAAVDAYGGLDILINNAGILRDRTILKMTPEEWNAVIEVHLTGTFSCLQAAGRLMKDQGRGGRIVNTSSSSGLLGNFGQSNYGAAKAGIHALTRIASWELARYQITVNALAPNALTRMTADLPGISASATEDNMGAHYMSPLIAYLASDLGAGITGETFGVDRNQIYVYKMLVSQGIDKRTDGAWEPSDLAPVIDRAISW